MKPDLAPLNQIKVLSFKDKGEWTLESKYNIGKKKVAAPEKLNGSAILIFPWNLPLKRLSFKKDKFDWADEGLSALVRVVILSWSAAILTLNYVTIPERTTEAD